MLLEKILFESGKSLYFRSHVAYLSLNFKKSPFCDMPYFSYPLACRKFVNLTFLKMTQKMTPSASFSFATCDLCDTHINDTTGQFRVLSPVFRDFGGVRKFSGPVVTVKCFEDNSLVKAAVDSPGEGRVLVVDGGASLRRALLGGNLAAAAAKNGWSGVVIDGCIRDVTELAQCAIGIRALAAMPLPTNKRQEGQRDLPVQVQGVWIRPGDWLYADEDGMVVMASPLIA